MSKNIAFTEEVYPTYYHSLTVDQDLYSKKNKYHEIRFFRNDAYGVVYTSDNIVQTTEKDEFVYHEMSAHVSMQTHGNVKTVLIIGGGGGGCLREILKYNSVEKVVVCEIDQDVYHGFQTYLDYSNGAFNDKRTHLLFSCGSSFVESCNDKYDLIICDAPDPVGCGASLFTDHFYRNCSKLLNKNGIMTGQIGVPFFQLDNAIRANIFLSAIFNNVRFYNAAVPIFCGGTMLFYMASNEQFRIVKRTTEPKGLKYFNSEVYNAAFALPNYIRTGLIT